MEDIIRLLPDAVANQIAAGEVVQRPASVVKELVENAIDAKSKSIRVNIKDSGRTLIQVIDDGGGMSVTDARLAFERHATSKIRQATDLFSLKTMGFRGEALASIAAVSEVSLKTRRSKDELGTEITIRSSEVMEQKPVNCPVGSNFMVKNLFFNIPARRKFLKAESTEFRHILYEIQRIALVYPDIHFQLIHNDNEIYNLPVAGLKERIVRVLGKGYNQHLASIQTETTIVKIYGYIGKPEVAKKRSAEQFFFVNGRYMRHSYFHKSVMNAYEQILPPDAQPVYLVYLETDPETIDVNIHPTKTEIKFENEQAIFKIINSAVREGLGKFNIIPALDFDTSGKVEMPVYREGTPIRMPEITVNPDYNPFHGSSTGGNNYKKHQEDMNLPAWENLYNGFENSAKVPFDMNNKPEEKQGEADFKSNLNSSFFQIRGKYMLTPVKSGIMIIDQRRAHERVLYDRFLKSLKGRMGVSQQLLYPQELEMRPEDMEYASKILPELLKAGFDIRVRDGHILEIMGIPSGLHESDAIGILEIVLNDIENENPEPGEKFSEKLAAIMARAASIPAGKILNPEEMQELFDKLFVSEMPNFSPSGKKILDIIPYGEIEKRLG